MEKTITTLSGLKKMEDELNRLKTTELSEILVALTEARDKGDISENAEYDIAKENYDNLQRKISLMNEKLKSVVIISETDINTDSVQALTTVKFLNKKTNVEQIFTLVPETDINIKEGKISLNSPIALGLMGKKVGDIATINIPAGVLELEILNISVT